MSTNTIPESFSGSIEFIEDANLTVQTVLGSPFQRKYKKGRMLHNCEVTYYYHRNVLTANLMIEKYLALGINASLFVTLSKRQVLISKILRDLEKDTAI